MRTVDLLRRESLLLVFNTRKYKKFSSTLERRVRELRLRLASEREAKHGKE